MFATCKWERPHISFREIDFINGYVVDTARQFGVHTPVNTAIVETVYAIARGQSAPDPNLLGKILQTGR
jgi:Ketopantoate reductase PanE/ApbA C terminal